jgi:hypothetical protein
VGVDQVAQRANEALHVFLAVRERDQGHDPAVVDELDVDLTLVAQPVVCAVPGEPDRGRLDHHARRVHAGHARQAGQTCSVDHSQLGYLRSNQLAHQAGGLDRAVEQVAPLADELGARAVDARQQDCRGARRLFELEAQLQALAVDAVRADRQHGRLAQAGERLVDRTDGQVRALRQGALR